MAITLEFIDFDVPISMGTSSMCLTTERDERIKAMRGFWKTATSKV